MNKLNNLKNYGWKSIDWAQTRKTVFKWQMEIYKASKSNEAGSIQTVRKYQHRIIESIEAKLLAVRRVTQDNRGKNTAGVDGIKSISPEKRIDLAKNLVLPIKGSPLRRVWIPKPGKPEKKTFRDPCDKRQMRPSAFQNGFRAGMGSQI